MCMYMYIQVQRNSNSIIASRDLMLNNCIKLTLYAGFFTCNILREMPRG